MDVAVICRVLTNDFQTCNFSQLYIWDFSGQTTQFFVNDKSKSPRDCQRPPDQEVSFGFFGFLRDDMLDSVIIHFKAYWVYN